MTITTTVRESATGLNLVGTVHIDVVASPTPIRIEYYLDNVLMYAPSTLVTTWTWDTTKVGNGTHIVRTEAVYKSRRSKSQLAVSVNNSVTNVTTFGTGLFGSGAFGGTLTLRRLWHRVTGFFGKAPKNI